VRYHTYRADKSALQATTSVPRFALVSFVLGACPCSNCSAGLGSELHPFGGVRSHIDDRGCLQCKATARIDAPVKEVFALLSRPELAWRFVPGANLIGVYVKTDYPPCKSSRRSRRRELGEVSKSASKILEFVSSAGPSWGPDGPPTWWIEFRIDPDTQTIYQRQIGSTLAPAFFNPEFSSSY
jgi:hypothetical protein